MDSVKSTMREKLKTIGWATKIAWQIDKGMLFIWLTLSIGLSVMPAIALGYNREVISRISEFVVSGTGSFADVVPTIIILGVIMKIGRAHV